MKHCILVKWKESVANKAALVDEARKIFLRLLTIEGIHEVKVYDNVVNRPNRFDVMICIKMDKDVLPIYDESEPHHEWKEKYGKFVENKVVFDYEG